MEEAPPVLKLDDTIRDLNRLSWMHMVFAAVLCCVGIAMYFFFAQPMLAAIDRSEKGRSDPFNAAISWIFVAALIQLVATVTLNLLAAHSLKQRTRMWAPMVASCLIVTSFPLGTALATYTFVVLTRPAAKALFR